MQNVKFRLNAHERLQFKNLLFDPNTKRRN